jgi:hypothetical protein
MTMHLKSKDGSISGLISMRKSSLFHNFRLFIQSPKCFRYVFP